MNFILESYLLPMNIKLVLRGINIILLVFIILNLHSCSSDTASLKTKLNLINVTENAEFIPRDSMGALVFKDMIWLFGGFTPERSNAVWVSKDGKNWSKKPIPIWSKRNLPGAVVFKNKLWIMGGLGKGTYLNDIYSSEDGESWKLEKRSASWSPRGSYGLLEFQGKLFLFGGNCNSLNKALNDVWESEDGINWKLILNAAPWGRRGMFACTVFHDKIWILGGGIYSEEYIYNVKSNLNDVWSSADGIKWNKETDSADFSPRRFFKAAVYNNQLYITSGFELNSWIFKNQKSGVRKNDHWWFKQYFFNDYVARRFYNLNDIWVTNNGKNWQSTTLNKTFPVRHEPSFVTFRDTMYVIGGFGTELYNDVWKIELTP